MHYPKLPDYITGLPENHSLRVYFEENEFIKKLLVELQMASPVQDFQKFINVFNHVCAIEKRYARKENQLFPFLEKRGWYGPSQGMWAFHDSIRDIIRAIRVQIESKDIASVTENIRILIENMHHMIHVEENRLFPNALQLLQPEDWDAMIAGDEEIGWVDQDRRVTKEQPEKTTGPLDLSKLKMDEGFLNLEQINLILKFLPVDVTFVDENDKVAFYNRGEERVFPRSAGVIGREVRFCHPPKSVDTVLRILEEFKAGRKDEAEFWIQFKGRTIHIRYFAVRDKEKNYKGVLEMSQDITDIQKIQGEKRLLSWDQ
ncbi:PAS domain-containing protein [Bdellovibrio bacteriovorus]|uniref:DUF438 domain-containing protein n=1 Tax=Bdellovibrio bacteriovorus TaxID=959 RepID=UPI0021D19205|nr:PAS domain-containing protein [Bdellovibrio bacteriovorus]UXR65299.1 PAS domain-containing protein [Bdellovibrio bacteriovorus]